MRKIIQRKVYYVCKSCHRERSVIIGLGAADKNKFNPETHKSEHVGYRRTFKIWYCLSCHTVYKLSAAGYLSWLVRIRLSRYSIMPLFKPSSARIKEAVGVQCNLREVIEYEKENSPSV